MNNSLPIKKILTLLEKTALVSHIESLETDKIFGTACCKIRCKLFPTRYLLHILLLKTDREFIYTYRLTHALTDRKFVPRFPDNIENSEKLLAKWDNIAHYPGINTYPHHYHNEKDGILLSNIEGNPDSLLDDIKIVLSDITELLGKIHRTYISVEDLRITVT